MGRLMGHIEKLNEADALQGEIHSHEEEAIPDIQSPPEILLAQIKAILANGPVLYDEVISQTGASEDEVREAIRTWYGLISGRITGMGEDFYWWIDPAFTKENRA